MLDSDIIACADTIRELLPRCGKDWHLYIRKGSSVVSIFFDGPVGAYFADFDTIFEANAFVVGYLAAKENKLPTGQIK